MYITIYSTVRNSTKNINHAVHKPTTIQIYSNILNNDIHIYDIQTHTHKHTYLYI